jgi:hypothetical protein
MADSIAKMSFLLTSDVGGFSAGMKQAQQEAGQAASGIMNAMKGAMPGGLGEMFSMGAGLATGTASIQGLQTAVTSTWHAMTELAQEARNITRESEHLGVSVTFYEQMSQACERAGVETDSLARGMERIQRGLGDWKAASAGPQQAGDQFRAINLDPRKLAAEAPEEQFKQIAEHLLSIQDRATRATAEMAIFGRNGEELEKTFKEIVSGSRPPILSAEEIESLAALQKASGGAGRELAVTGKQMTADLAGAVLPLVQTFASGLDYFLGSKAAAGETAEAMADQAEAARKIGGALHEAQAAQHRMAEDARQHERSVATAAQAANQLRRLGDQLNGTPSWLRELRDLDHQHFLGGMSYDQRANFNQSFEQDHRMIDQAAEGSKIAEAVASALKGIESPSEKFLGEMRQISQWQTEGRVSGQQATALGIHARDELTSAWAGQASRLPGLNERGSVGEHEVITQAMTGQKDMQTRLADLQQQAVDAGQKAADLLDQINQALSNRPVVGAGG